MDLTCCTCSHFENLGDIHKGICQEDPCLLELVRKVADIFDIEMEKLFIPVRNPKVLQAGSLLCFWAVRELGMTATGLAKKFGLTRPAESIAVKRCEKIAMEKGLSITDGKYFMYLWTSEEHPPRRPQKGPNSNFCDIMLLSPPESSVILGITPVSPV